MGTSTFDHCIYVRATPEDVWRGLTEAEITRQYWRHENVSDWQPGSRWTHRRTDEEGTVDVAGDVLEADRPRRLTLTWVEPADRDEPSKPATVTFETEPMDWPHGPWTRLHLQHAGLEDGSDTFRTCASGWPAVLSGLKTVLEARRREALGAETLMGHWKGHRRLTRRVIEAFPEDALFSFSLGGMRPFGEMVREMLALGAPMMRGVVHERWDDYALPEETTRAGLLRRWDADSDEIEELWSLIPPGRFWETMTAFGRYEGKVHDLLFYVIDNENHHRGQGYVYLRALGVEPPAFYERG